jgi:hypothetical protein
MTIKDTLTAAEWNELQQYAIFRWAFSDEHIQSAEIGYFFAIRLEEKWRKIEELGNRIISHMIRTVFPI